MKLSTLYQAKEKTMVLQKVSILLHTIASASFPAPLSEVKELITLDNTDEALKVQRLREAQKRQAQEQIASLKQLDASQLPLVATDRSGFERALLEVGSTTPTKSQGRTNGSTRKKENATTTVIRIDPWIYKAAEVRFIHKEAIS
jgi:hypothetical protein